MPGISIGHNGRIAFGLTIFPIDQEDLDVYRTNPADRREYAYQGHWERMECVRETVPVRGREPLEIELWFTRHGPVIYERDDRDTAFAVRAAWLEPGMAPYLGSMDYMGASGPEEFVAAMSRWGAPGENQVYAAPDGTIGWRPAGLVPRRVNWDGSLPVPGDGRYEWDGFHHMDDLTSVRNPEQGWFATANQLNLPDGYPHTVTHDWYAPFRHERIAEELGSRTGWTVADCVRLQTDYVSLPARRIQPLLSDLTSDDAEITKALGLLRQWDATLSADSGAAALFEVWYWRHLRPAVLDAALTSLVPPDRRAQALTRILPAGEEAADARVDLRLLLCPGDRLGPPGTLPKIMLSTLADAVAEVEGLLGGMESWAWCRLHQAEPRHPLGESGPSVGPVPRGGSGDTVGSTPYTPDFRQSGGATFRLVIDVGAWDASVAMNSPGQSGVPNSPHHHDLFESWAADEAFPLLYSRESVERNLDERILLNPA